ncbi:hypothetical protein [Rhizomicrobium electricum]|uniref:Uncharacterized protein n=1 Tax=Rhizomicrobium electricum TaxID=480070 RepID=A0ABN1EX71_9PROT|nr:hypothetical protein [Rhizomicrobium electricum]NIJ49973.1 hypothetical protein [Rhizomicrobium electricum]
MLDASDALHAHIHCRAMLVQCLKQRQACLEYVDFAPHTNCALVRFVNECAARHADWPEIDILRSAHNNLHVLAKDIARRLIAGEYVDINAENAPNGRIDNASAALVAAVWRVERRLHSLAG